MDADELRAMQAPLKRRYKENPDAALITLRAKGSLGDQSLTCKVETGKALVEAGLHPATGGDGLSACSGDMLLEALVACAGVIEKWKGSGLVWSLLSNDMKEYRFGVHRAVKRFLNSYIVDRLECTVDPTSVHAVHWARRLGFQYESTMPKYAPNGSTMDMYVRIR